MALLRCCLHSGDFTLLEYENTVKLSSPVISGNRLLSTCHIKHSSLPVSHFHVHTHLTLITCCKYIFIVTVKDPCKKKNVKKKGEQILRLNCQQSRLFILTAAEYTIDNFKGSKPCRPNNKTKTDVSFQRYITKHLKAEFACDFYFKMPKLFQTIKGISPNQITAQSHTQFEHASFKLNKSLVLTKPFFFFVKKQEVS